MLIVSVYLLQYVFQVQEERGEQIYCCLERFLLPQLSFWLWWDWQAGYRLKETEEILGNQSAGPSLNSWLLKLAQPPSCWLGLGMLPIPPCLFHLLCARIEEWRLIPEHTKHSKMTWNTLQCCQWGINMVLLKCPTGTSYPPLNTFIARKNDQEINDYLAISLYWFAKKGVYLLSVYLLKHEKPDFWLHL